MINEDLAKEVPLKLSVGHLVVVWDVLANKLSGTASIEGLSDAEKRAVWALQDLCERGLVDFGIGARPESDWNALVQAARNHVTGIAVEFLD